MENKKEKIIDMDDLVDKVTDLGIERGWYNKKGEWKSEKHRQMAYKLIYQKYDVQIDSSLNKENNYSYEEQRRRALD